MSVDIRFYENKMDLSVFKSSSSQAGKTFHEWVSANVPKYQYLPELGFSTQLNGLEFPYQDWKTKQLIDSDLVECFMEPREAVSMTMVIIAVVSAAAAIYYANQAIPDNYNSTTPNGSSIYDVNAQGNRAKLMGTRPVLFGHHIVYPDYLTIPFSRFIDGEQWKYFLLYITDGEVELLPENILFGNTPVNRYATDIFYEVFGPDVDVSGNEAHRNFYSSPEVGGDGLEINHPDTIFIAEEGTSRYIETAPIFGTDWLRDLRFYDGTGKPYNFPWPVGSKIQLDGLNVSSELYAGVVDVVDMGVGVPDKITADYGLNVANVGDSVQLVGLGGNDNNYLIKTISDTEITFTDLEGVDVLSLSPLSREFLRILRDDPLRDLYEVVDGTGQQIITVSKVGDPDWAGFTSNLRYYDITCELIDGGITPVSIGPFVAAPANVETSLIELDFVFDGLNRLDSSGDVKSHTVSFVVQYREIGTIDWTSESHDFTEATRDQFGKTITINLPKKMAIEVQVQRTSHQEDNIRLSEKVRWTGLRAELPAATSYAGATTIAFKIRGSNALSASAENKLNVIPTRKLLCMDGNGDFTDFKATSSISAAMYEVCKSVGNADEQIGMDELARLDEIWEGRGDEFNGVFDNESTMWEALKRVLAVGFAEPTLDFGQIIPVRDEPRTTFNNMYSADNILPNTWKMSAETIKSSEPDGFEVEYFSTETWKSETILCLLPGDAGLNPEKYRAYGVTNRDKAYQIGMRKRSIQRWRRTAYSFSTEMDALRSSYLSYDAHGVDIPLYHQTGRVEAVERRVVYVNQDLVFNEGENFISIRRVDGSLSGPYTCTAGPERSSVVLDRDLDFTPVINGSQEPPYFIFGEPFKMLTTNIDPQGTDTVKVEAANYDDRCYLYDDAVAPN